MSLLSVYNHLISGQIFMRQTRFDTHKKEELRDIYQKIRRMSVDQPFYKVDFDTETQEFTLGVKAKAMELSTTLKELNQEENVNMFSDKMLISDKPDKVAVTRLEGSSVEDFEPMEVAVNSISGTQRNEGKYVLSEGQDLTPGQYSFTVDIEEDAYSFQYNVAEDATNGELLTKLADFINKTQIGIRARVGGNNENGVSRIELVSNEAGTGTEDGVSFRFTDTKTPSRNQVGIVQYFGLNNVVRNAQNTEFSINGENYTIRTHEFVTDSGVRLDFFKPTDEDETVSILSAVVDTPIIAKAEEFASQYNTLIDFISSAAKTKQSPKKLLYELSSIASRYKDVLNEIGLFTDENRRLVIDKEQMTKSIRNGRLQEEMSNKDGVYGRLVNKLYDVSLNPMDFVDKKVITYPNTSVKNPYNPYITSIYSGLIYNNYC